MSPYVAAAVVGSLHHALTAVLMLALVMGVVVGFGVGTAVIVGPGVLVGAGDGAGVGKAVVGAGVIVGTAVIVGAGLAVGCGVGSTTTTKLDAEHSVEQAAPKQLMPEPLATVTPSGSAMYQLASIP